MSIVTFLNEQNCKLVTWNEMGQQLRNVWCPEPPANPDDHRYFTYQGVVYNLDNLLAPGITDQLHRHGVVRYKPLGSNMGIAVKSGVQRNDFGQPCASVSAYWFG